MAVNKTQAEQRSDLESEVVRLEQAALPVPKPKITPAKLDELSYTAPTDAEIASRAETGLADYKAQNENRLRTDSELEAKELSEKKASYEKGRAADLESLGESYKAAARAIDNDVIKRGIARSSVAAVQKAELEAEYLKRNADIAESYGKKISELDGEIAAAGTKLTRALNDFNLSYATKLKTKIEELVAERDKKTAEVIKYNNDVRAKQQSLDESLAKTESRLVSEGLAQSKEKATLDTLPSDKRNELYKTIYKKFDAYLAAMKPEDARVEVYNQKLFRDHLSDYYYYMLFDKYGRKG